MGFGGGRAGTLLERVLFEGGGSFGDDGNDNGDDGVSEGSRGRVLSGAGAGADADAGTGGRAGAARGCTAALPAASLMCRSQYGCLFMCRTSRLHFCEVRLGVT
jgi:hypothetical protein